MILLPVVDPDVTGVICAVKAVPRVFNGHILLAALLATGVTCCKPVSNCTVTRLVTLFNTNLTAGNLTGTIPSSVLGNSAHFIGTTSIALNRASGSQTLSGVSIDGNAATVSNGVYTTSTYSNPAWITSIDSGKISGTVASASQISATNWTVLESGGYLYFQYGGVNKMRLDSSGNLVTVGNVTAYGSI